MAITINTEDFKAVVNNDPNPNTSGFFVELMTSINAYVKGEFDSGRITGTEYATVYLGAMQSAIAQSVQYASQKATSDAQVALLTAQKLQVEAETLNVPKQGSLLDAEITKFNTEVSLTQAKILTEAAQPDAVKATTDLTRAKVATEVSNRASLAAQTVLYKTQAAAFKGKQSLDAVSKMIDGVTMITTSKVPGAEISAAELAMFGNSSAIQSAMNIALTFPDINDEFMHVYPT
jgi:hypothetical protein